MPHNTAARHSHQQSVLPVCSVHSRETSEKGDCDRQCLLEKRQCSLSVCVKSDTGSAGQNIANMHPGPNALIKFSHVHFLIISVSVL